MCSMCECEVIGDKVGGIAVHTGARIAGQAGPAGEVLVSSTVRDLVDLFRTRVRRTLIGVSAGGCRRRWLPAPVKSG